MEMARRFARFNEMKERGFFQNRMAAWRAVHDYGFPAPIEMAPNTVAWDLDEAEAHVATLPRRAPGQPSRKKGGRKPSTTNVTTIEAPRAPDDAVPARKTTPPSRKDKHDACKKTEPAGRGQRA
jgi:predicted DNA-binding transcriptional regulator AlpA